MEIRRVLELYDARGKKGGSGYLLSDRLILTAAHVVGAVGDACEWRPAIPVGTTSAASAWKGAVVVWTGGDFDAALLQPSDGEVFVTGLSPTSFGFPDGREAIEADASGFPTAIDHGSRTDILHVEGKVDPLSGSRTQSPIFDIGSAVPAEAAGWKGMSGAAVFAGDVLIGVIEEVPVALGTTTLRIVPIQKVIAVAEAAALLTAAALSTTVDPVTPNDIARAKRRRQAMSFRGTYAATVVDQYCQLDYAGLPGDRGSVSRNALDGFRDMRFAAADANAAEEIRITELSGQSQFVLIGEPGSGKSTALKQAVALAVQEDAECVPVWLPASSLPSGRLALPGLIHLMSQAAAELGMTRADDEFFTFAVDDKKLVLAVDALDEAHESRRQAVRDLVESAAQKWKGCRVWLTSRPDQYWKTPVHSVKVWRIRPLNTVAVADFLRICFDDDGELARLFLSRPDLAAILETPQTLSMLARVARAQGSLPASRAQIYEQWIHVVCSTWEDTKHEPATSDEVADRKKGLQLIAWAVQQTNHASPFTMKQAQRAVRELFGPRGELGGEGLVKWLIERSGVLDWTDESSADSSSRQIRFSHLQFQEYLAAAEFVTRWTDQRDVVLDFISTRWWNEDWFELLRFAVALLADESNSLLNQILAAQDPYADLLHREVLLAARLISDLEQPDAKFASEIQRRLQTVAIESAYLYIEVCARLVGIAHHDAATRALEEIVSGALLKRVVERNGISEDEAATLNDRMDVTLRGVEMLASLKGAPYALRIAVQFLPFPNPLDEADAIPLAIMLDVLALRHRLGDDTAKRGFEVLMHRHASIRDRQTIVERLDALHESEFSNGVLADVIKRNARAIDLPFVVWCLHRGISAVTPEVLKTSVEGASALIKSTGAQSHPDENVSKAVDAALDLWKTNPIPELHTLFETVFDSPGLLWQWAYRIRELAPDLAGRAVDAMVKLAIDPNLCDNSRRNGMVYKLVHDDDDSLVVPALLRLLEADSTLRWTGESIADSLKARGREADVLQLMKKLAIPSGMYSDRPGRALAVANHIRPGVIYDWLDAMWRSSGDPKTDAAVLEHQWQNSGVAPFARSWFAKIVQTEDGRAFLEAARTNPRDTGLTDEARQALFGGALESGGGDDDDDKTAPDYVDLQERISTALSKGGSRFRDITDILEQMSDIGRREEALQYASQWIGGLDPKETGSALDLINRLEYLSWSDLWLASWTDLLARAIRSLPVAERSKWIELLRQRA